MKLQTTPIADLLIIELDSYQDPRGVFCEMYHKEKFHHLGLDIPFVQDNCSLSKPNVLRGLHYQKHKPQGKLVGVLSGAIWDVAVDVRPKSPTFGKHFGLKLSFDNHLLFWIPRGFLHGFLTLSDTTIHEETIVLYKVDELYSPDFDTGVHWKDPELDIPWPLSTPPIISKKDASLMSFASFKENQI